MSKSRRRDDDEKMQRGFKAILNLLLNVFFLVGFNWRMLCVVYKKLSIKILYQNTIGAIGIYADI